MSPPGTYPRGALQCSYLNITRHPKWVIPWLEDDPGLTSLELWVNRTLEHNAQAKAYGASGLLNIHWRTRSIAPQGSASLSWAWNTSLTSAAFWAEWAGIYFGTSAGAAAAPIFASLDSNGAPRPVNWVGGPGAWTADAKACQLLADGTYAFPDTFAALRPLVLRDIAAGVADAGSLERFDYWLTTLRYTRGIARTTCAWSEYDAVYKSIAAMPSGPARQAAAQDAGYAAFAALVGNATQAQWDLLSSASSPGELGTIVNTQTHSLLPNAIGAAAQAALSALAGQPLPASLLPPTTWDAGRVPLLRVPVARSFLQADEDLRVSAMLVAHPSFTPAHNVTLYVSPLTTVIAPQWQAFPMAQSSDGVVPRQVFTVVVPSASLPWFDKALQWYVEAVLPGNTTAFSGPGALLPSPGALFGPGAITLRFPPTAPKAAQTVLLLELD